MPAKVLKGTRRNSICSVVIWKVAWTDRLLRPLWLRNPLASYSELAANRKVQPGAAQESETFE
jgi:hypothetical protein